MICANIDYIFYLLFYYVKAVSISSSNGFFIETNFYSSI